MLYLFHGTDGDKIRAKVAEVVSKLMLKRPDASVFSFDAESWDGARFEEMIGAETLFAGKSIVIGKGLFASPLAAEFILKHAKEISESGNIFLLEEGELKKEIVSKIEKKAEKVQEMSKSVKATSPKDSFNIYAFSDALGDRNLRELWVQYHRGQGAGLALEELFFKCSWQVKNMILSRRGLKTPTAEALKMNSYVFGKAARAAANFTEDELVGLHRRLLVLWHDSHHGKGDFAMGLERFILEL